MENLFDFDALNPAFQDFPEMDMDLIEELETDLLEGEFDDETDFADENGVFLGDDDEVDCELLLIGEHDDLWD